MRPCQAGLGKPTKPVGCGNPRLGQQQKNRFLRSFQIPLQIKRIRAQFLPFSISTDFASPNSQFQRHHLCCSTCAPSPVSSVTSTTPSPCERENLKISKQLDMGTAYESFTAGKSFELDTRDPCLDIQLNDSTELWLIQWPRKEFKSQDFDGKEFKLKLHDDGTIGSLKNSSGKSYEIVSYGAHVPNAQVFLPTSSGSKSVGKFSRRVSLFPEFDLEEYKSPLIPNPNLSSQRGSVARSSQNRSSALRGRSFSIAHSTETETPKAHRKRSHGSRPESQVTDVSGEKSRNVGQSMDNPEASRKKRSNDHQAAESLVSDVSFHSEEKSKKKNKKEKS